MSYTDNGFHLKSEFTKKCPTQTKPLPCESEVFMPPPLPQEKKKETAALVSCLLLERLGPGKEFLVARYLEGGQSTRRNLMPVLNTASESLR